MKNFNQIFNQIMLENLYPNIYQINKEQLLKEDLEQNILKNNAFLEEADYGKFICQKRYFDCISQSIEDFFVEKFKELKETTGDGLYHSFLEISEIVKHMNKDDFKFYKNLDQFLEFLKYVPGQLTLQIQYEKLLKILNIIFIN